MAVQTVFKRYELKYLLTPAQKQAVLQAMHTHMALDSYGRTTIRNIYFDTDSFRLIRRSLDKPVYKEKLRIRSYRRTMADSTVFVELKKKYDGIVYKRRVTLSQREAMDWLTGRSRGTQPGQICREVDYFLSYYGSLSPAVFLSYEREAYYSLEGSDFRVTFDENILARREHICLDSDIYGEALLPEGMTLLELKCSGGIPLWMVQVLSRERIYKTSFSKYGAAYRSLIYPCLGRENSNHIQEEAYRAG